MWVRAEFGVAVSSASTGSSAVFWMATSRVDPVERFLHSPHRNFSSLTPPCRLSSCEAFSRALRRRRDLEVGAIQCTPGPSIRHDDPKE